MNFKEINGEVFYYIKPTYIDINTNTPKFINVSPDSRIDPEDIAKSLASPEMLKLLMADINCRIGTNS